MARATPPPPPRALFTIFLVDESSALGRALSVWLWRTDLKLAGGSMHFIINDAKSSVKIAPSTFRRLRTLSPLSPFFGASPRPPVPF